MRTAAWLSALMLAVGTLLLVEPASDPVSTKIALAVVREPGAASPASARVPASLRQAAAFLAPSRTWPEIVEALGRDFAPSNAQPLPATLPLEELVAGVRAGRGDCSRKSEALLALCAAAGRPCREWGNVAYPQEPGTGHSVVDVWLPRREAWAMVDVFLGFWARGPDGEPMGTEAFRDAFVTDPSRVRIEALAGRQIREADLLQYYGDPALRRVLLVRNDPVRLASHWTRAVERVNLPAGQLLQWAAGVGPRYVLPRGPGYDELARDLEALRRRALVGGGLAGLGAVGLLALGMRWTGHRRRERRLDAADISAGSCS